MVVVATPVVDDVLKDLVRADVDPIVVDDDVNELSVVDELFVVDLDVSHVDLVVDSLSPTLVDELRVVVLFDVELDISDLVDVVVVRVHVYIVVINLHVVIVNLLVVELYLSIVESLVVLVGTLYLVDELCLVVDH